MPKKEAAEVLEWINLAIGAGTPEEEPLDLVSVMAKLQQLKTESSLNKNEADRYKRELEDVKRESLDSKSKLETTMSQLTKELEISNGEAERYKAKWETVTKSSDESLSAERAKVAYLMEQRENYRGELVKLKAMRETVQRSFNESLSAERAKVAHITEQRDHYRGEFEKLKAMVDAKSSNDNTAAEKVFQLSQELESVKRDADLFKTQRNEMEAKYLAKHRELESVKRDADLFKTQRNEMEEKYLAMHHENNATAREWMVKYEKLHMKKNSETEFYKNMIKEMIPLESYIEFVLPKVNPEETTIRAKFTEITKLTKHAVYSPPTEIDGKYWRLIIRKNGDSLGIHMSIQRPYHPKWSCSAVFEVHLISQKEYFSFKTKSSGRKRHSFDQEFPLWGMDKFITLKELFDKEKGYVKDNSIIVIAVITADPYGTVQAKWPRGSQNY